jgi:hypothetical protein
MTYTVVVTAADGTSTSSTVTPVDGVITLELKYESVASVTIAPVIG